MKRIFILIVSLAAAASAAEPVVQPAVPPTNLLVLLADQWRADALGCAGNRDVQTPNIDRLQKQSLDFSQAVSSVPVCSPMRASFLTGQRPLTHGVFLNDVHLPDSAVTLAESLAAAGYDTAFVGKWHLNGRGRSAFIPPDQRQGFQYWKAQECTHDYNHSRFYAGNDPSPRQWPGYDAEAQTRDVLDYLKSPERARKPFFLVLAWGPPHAPYDTAPHEDQKRYNPQSLHLRPNVPGYIRPQVRRDLAGYYAHCTAVDRCVGQIMETLRQTGLDRHTLVVFTADHGDMLGSHGAYKKQQPYEESVHVPLLFHAPGLFGDAGKPLDATIATEDLMPTLLGLLHQPIPKSVEGLDFSGFIRGGPDPSDGAALIACPAPFGQWARKWGGREYRGIRTARYTYVRDLRGPWLLFDRQEDPFQLNNLVDRPETAALQAGLEMHLRRKLTRAGDAFLPAAEYIRQWNYRVDATGTVPYEP